MNKQQTAVEWLIDNLKGQLNIDEVTYIIKRSKEMEKEQHEKTWSDSFEFFVLDVGIEFQNYYEQTYGGNK